MDIATLGLTSEQFECIRHHFESYDRAQTGEIQVQDFSLLSTDLGEEFTKGEILEAVQALDPNHKGSIAFKAFVRWWVGA